MPRLQRLAQFELNALVFGLAAERKTKFGLRFVPVGAEGVAMRSQIGEHVEDIFPDEVRQHESVVQRRAPARQRPVERVTPQAGEDCADEQLLGQAHARVRRHLEAAELDESETAGWAVRRIELVDADFRAMGVAGHVGENVAHQAIEQPWPWGVSLSGPRYLGERDLQFVKTVVARLVDARRLAGRTDEQAGEEIGQAWMPQPMDDKTFQQVGTPQERAV